VGVSIENLKVLVKCLNCIMMDVPFKYLGMLIGENPKRGFFTLIIDKIKSILSI